MRGLLKCAGIFLISALFFSCKHKKKQSLAGEEPVAVTDFIDFFPPTQLAYTVGDSIFQKKDKDSLLISYKVFTQFVPDSVLRKTFGKNVKPRIFPMARIDVPNAETYLFAKALAGDTRAVIVMGFQHNHQFIAAIPIMKRSASASLTQSIVMDRKYSITRAVARKNADGSVSEGRDVYILNEGAGSFTLIVTDALDDKLNELVNPIDTFSRKHKLSADYAVGKTNLVSIRDGRKNDRLTFFIHFESNGGECGGELKGEAILRGPNMAEYRENGDPCVLQFNFTSGAVTLKEEEGCGSHRGVRCNFAGTFIKKKYIKPASSVKTPVKPPAKKKT